MASETRAGILDTLFAPIPRARFLEAYWTRRAVALTGRGEPLDSVASLPALELALRGRAGLSARTYACLATRCPERLGIQPDQVDDLLRAGARIELDRLEDIEEGARRAVHSIVRELRLTVTPTFRLVLFPADHWTGLASRAAETFSFVLRGELETRYTVAPDVRAAVRDRHSASFEETMLADGDTRTGEALLGEGEGVYLPSGCWSSRGTLEGAVVLEIDIPQSSVLQSISSHLGQRLDHELGFRTLPSIDAPSASPEEFFASRLQEVDAATAQLRPEDLFNRWAAELHRVSQSLSSMGVAPSRPEESNRAAASPPGREA